MYYSIECYKGNGQNKPYPSDKISIMDENLNDLINKFLFAHKHFDFTKWKVCYLVKWNYEGFGDYDPSEPIQIIQIIFKYRRIEIEGIGIYET